jgi:DNA-binding PadR family transcriptional regulator
MEDQKQLQFHMLNFFFVKNDFASTEEMNQDFRKSGISTGQPGFQILLDEGWVDTRKSNIGRFEYKINEDGKRRRERLLNELEPPTNKMQNIRFEILKYLQDNNGTADIYKFIHSASGNKQNIINTIGKMADDEGLIEIPPTQRLNLFAGINMNNPFSEDEESTISITLKGIEVYMNWFMHFGSEKTITHPIAKIEHHEYHAPVTNITGDQNIVAQASSSSGDIIQNIKTTQSKKFNADNEKVNKRKWFSKLIWPLIVALLAVLWELWLKRYLR